MRANIEKFLTFCDNNGLSFSVPYRANFRDPNARFYLTFGTYHEVKIIEDNGSLTDFGFTDGNTPNEAIENCIKELKGCYLQFQRCIDGEHVIRTAIFR